MPVQRDRFIELLYAVILAQFVVIAILLGGLSNEYLSNAFMQTWVARNAPMLRILLNGGVDALLIGMAVGMTILLAQRRIEFTKSARDASLVDESPRPPSASPQMLIRGPQDELLPDSPPSRKRSTVRKSHDNARPELQKPDS